MSNLKQEIAEKITSNRQKLSPSSLKTYVSILFNIHKSMNSDNDKIEWFSDNVKDIIEYIKGKNNQTKKTSLSALYVLTGKQEYRDIMMQVMKEVNATYQEQKKTPSEAKNWISEDEVKAVYFAELENAVHMLSTKKVFNDNRYVQYLLVSFLSGVVIPPRRSMDYGEMKIRNYDPKHDNFYRAGKFYFNKYKTAKTYGMQVLNVPNQLNLMIKRWIKLNTTDYMLYSSNKQKLSSPQINRILNNAFGGKNISTNMLRHIYLSSVYANIPALATIDKLAEDMGHSSSQALEYIKH